MWECITLTTGLIPILHYNLILTKVMVSSDNCYFIKKNRPYFGFSDDLFCPEVVHLLLCQIYHLFYSVSLSLKIQIDPNFF